MGFAGWAIRGIFFLITAGAGWQVSRSLQMDPLLPVLVAVGLFIFVCLAEIFLFRGAIADLSAIVFGVLAGFVLAALFYYLGTLMMDPADIAQYGPALRISLAVLFSYLMVMIVYKTRDKFHFVIPYVEFRRQSRGPKPLLLDTSAIIDGRAEEILENWPPDGPVVVPTFVIEELHRLSDSANRLKRLRGRRGLDMLNTLRRAFRYEFIIDDTEVSSAQGVDVKLLRLAASMDGRILTGDFNLTKVARLQEVEVLNINSLAKAFRPVALPGEELSLELVRKGEGVGQAVGYLEDGTMVVAENGESEVGQETTLTVTKVLQTSAGRMIFGRV